MIRAHEGPGYVGRPPCRAGGLVSPRVDHWCPLEGCLGEAGPIISTAADARLTHVVSSRSDQRGCTCFATGRAVRQGYAVRRSPAHHRLAHVRAGRADAILAGDASHAETFATRAVLVMPVVLLVQVLSLVL